MTVAHLFFFLCKSQTPQQGCTLACHAQVFHLFTLGSSIKARVLSIVYSVVTMKIIAIVINVLFLCCIFLNDLIRNNSKIMIRMVSFY